MKNCFPAKSALVALAALTLALVGCGRREPAGYQGYLEGEFVQLAAPLAGRLEKLTVAKGARVTAGTPLFQLEQGAESAALGEAVGRVRAAQARLADLRKGQRPTELAVIEARFAQARAAAELSTRELERLTKLHENRVASDDDFDRARLNQEAATKQVAELVAQLETARLGARTDVIAAAEAETAAAQAALDRAGWAVAQKSVSAPRDGLIYDTLYREGEFVAAAMPVITLLPPDNLKVRFFVPEADFGALKAGDTVQVALTGRSAPLEARISYLSPKPEYTPPVLYNRENRSKLVFMVEASFDNAVARDLHPGQPVEVTPSK
ncbi:MAG: HlyD family secretion protein [Verrucomicrobiota bacterium]|nr:HlyD family secretion protein [Verrucomicrobiota bacterium]